MMKKFTDKLFNFEIVLIFSIIVLAGLYFVYEIISSI